MRLVALCLVLLWPANAVAQCIQQDYSTQGEEPDWECEAPMEGALIPKLTFTHTTAAIAENSPAPFTGILMDQDRVLSLGLRIKALRRLLWLEVQDRKKLMAVDKAYIESSAKTEINLVEYQRDAWKTKADQVSAELREDQNRE